MSECPRCQLTMLLTSTPEGRAYRCADWNCLTQGEVIDDDVVLSIEAISADMAQRRHADASNQSAQQARYRIMASNLVSLPSARQYLSGPERATLQQAADILERLASAAEQAKRSKHQQALEIKQRDQVWLKKIALRIREQFHSAQLVELATNVLTLSDVLRDEVPPFEVEAINLIKNNHAPGDRVEVLTRCIQRFLEEQSHTLAHCLLQRHQTIDAAMHSLLAEFQRRRPDTPTTHAQELEGIHRLLQARAADPDTEQDHA